MAVKAKLTQGGDGTAIPSGFSGNYTEYKETISCTSNGYDWKQYSIPYGVYSILASTQFLPNTGSAQATRVDLLLMGRNSDPNGDSSAGQNRYTVITGSSTALSGSIGGILISNTSGIYVCGKQYTGNTLYVGVYGEAGTYSSGTKNLGVTLIRIA